MRKTLLPLLLILTITFIGCNEDDVIETEIDTVIDLQNLEMNIDENPTNEQVIGTIESNINSLTFNIVTQNPAGALAINPNTGTLTVADATIFDFETNNNITAEITATDGTVSKNETLTININNINEIGDFNYGGVVFWIDPTDSSKGLVCAVTDQSSSIQWHNTIQPSIAGTTSETIQTGSTNTDSIIASLGNSYAAGVARAYNGGGFNDWSLPSVDELKEMGINRAAINTTAAANSGTDLVAAPANASNGYWSSSQQTANNSIYLVNLLSGGKNGGYATNNASVRAVRSF